MSLDEVMENQASGTGFMLQVPEVKIPEFIGDGKYEIIPVIDNPVNAVAKQDQVVCSRKMTEKGCQFKISTLLEDISRIYQGLLWWCSGWHFLVWMPHRIVGFILLVKMKY